MLGENCLVWNVRGLNSRARRDVVRELVAQENISLISLQETKLDVCSVGLVPEICWTGFDCFYQPASNTCGGILLVWKTSVWSVTNPLIMSYSLTAKVSMLQSDETWWLTCVYGPQTDQEKLVFLDELREVRSSCSGTCSIWGDFNLIYQAEDKNNRMLCILGRTNATARPSNASTASLPLMIGSTLSPITNCPRCQRSALTTRLCCSELIASYRTANAFALKIFGRSVKDTYR